MAYQGINFANQRISPSDDGRLYQAIFNDGSIFGCALSYEGSMLTMEPGYLVIGGREMEVTEAENYNINEAVTGYAQLVLSIDLTRTSTISAFNQISTSVRYASSLNGFASLIQDDINGSASKYEAQLAIVSLGTGGITGIVEDMPLATLKGGGKTNLYAAISVKSPEGSIVTVTDGETLLETDNTSGLVLFAVPYAATWIVTITDPTDENEPQSEVVEITYEGQIASVELRYLAWLYKDGDEFVDITGGWTFFNPTSYSSGSGVKNANNIRLNGLIDGTVYAAGTTKKIDVTNRRTLTLSVAAINGTVTIGLASAKNAQTNSAYVASANTNSTGYGATIDLSSVSGEYYVVVSFGGVAGNYVDFDGVVIA